MTTFQMIDKRYNKVVRKIHIVFQRLTFSNGHSKVEIPDINSQELSNLVISPSGTVENAWKDVGSAISRAMETTKKEFEEKTH